MCRDHEVSSTQLRAVFLQVCANLGVMFGRILSEAKKPDQSVGRGVKTTLSPSRRMNTSRTDSGNRYSSGIVTVCERLFHPTRAVGLRVDV
jgi:hypothetical protein